MTNQQPAQTRSAPRRALASLRRKAREPVVIMRRRLTGTLAHHEFATEAPSNQQMVDIFAGQWITAFPDEIGVDAGWVNHFDPAVDPRVSWVDSNIPGGIAGKSVLELGPFEGYQTALLERAGASSVLAVEASQTALLKCLIVKELLGLNARFLYGDALAFLDDCTDRFDIVWASGILYHQADPIGFLSRAAAMGDHLFLHTHYYDESMIVGSGMQPRFITSKDEVVMWHGRPVRLHHYRYATDTSSGTFAGGPRSYANWITREDIEFILTELGLGSITYGVLDPGNSAGPAFFMLASRT